MNWLSSWSAFCSRSREEEAKRSVNCKQEIWLFSMNYLTLGSSVSDQLLSFHVHCCCAWPVVRSCSRSASPVHYYSHWYSPGRWIVALRLLSRPFHFHGRLHCLHSISPRPLHRYVVACAPSQSNHAIDSSTHPHRGCATKCNHPPREHCSTWTDAIHISRLRECWQTHSRQDESKSVMVVWWRDEWLLRGVGYPKKCTSFHVPISSKSIE